MYSSLPWDIKNKRKHLESFKICSYRFLIETKRNGKTLNRINDKRKLAEAVRKRKACVKIRILIM